MTEQQPTDPTAVARAVLDAYRDAWDAGDADAFGALFTDDATYVIFLGDALVGRAEITENHREVFTRWQRGTRMDVRIESVRQLAPTVLSVLTVGGIGHDPDHIAIDKLQTFVLVRTGDGWRVAAFHNTGMSTRTAAGHA